LEKPRRLIGMKVQDVMTGNPTVCDLNASLAEAAMKMWDNDCGVLPVLKDGQQVVGLITDRDICMALALQNCNPGDISAEKVITGEVFSVRPEDEVEKALELMQEHKVRRLPVLSSEGELKGILSMNDIVLKADDRRKPGEIAYADVVNTFKSIGAHPAPLKQKATAG
jgi:CBS domain-containing protein